jgi:AcrR family transcriptional regulator
MGGTGRTAATRKGERTRSRLLELAIEQFGQAGFRATSVTEIAHGTGIGQAAVYAYFANKRELFLAAVDTDATALVREAIDRARPGPAARLPIRLVVELFAGVDAHPLARRVLAGQEPDVLVDLLELPAITVGTDLLIEELVSAQARGEVRADLDAHAIAPGVEGLVLSMLLATVQVGRLGSPRRQAGVVAAFDALFQPTPVSPSPTP